MNTATSGFGISATEDRGGAKGTVGEGAGTSEESSVGQAETFRKTLRNDELKNMPRVFAYIIRTVGPGYRLNGSVPWVSHGRVVFWPMQEEDAARGEAG